MGKDEMPKQTTDMKVIGKPGTAGELIALLSQIPKNTPIAYHYEVTWEGKDLDILGDLQVTAWTHQDIKNGSPADGVRTWLLLSLCPSEETGESPSEMCHG